MVVNAEQTCQRYAGVTRHLGKWLVKLRYRGKDLTIGHYEDPQEAAYAADFARYMLLGLKPTHWHPKVVRPNFPPNRSYPRAHFRAPRVGRGGPGRGPQTPPG